VRCSNLRQLFTQAHMQPLGSSLVDKGACISAKSWSAQGIGSRDAEHLPVRCALGFKLDTLLKLSDVKGVDRKTSLLQFVVASLLKKRGERPGGVGTLSAQLSAVKPAANLQVRATSRAVDSKTWVALAYILLKTTIEVTLYVLRSSCRTST